jgi:hypothetical protein
MRTALQHVECFHLVLLRMLEARVDRDSWVVKGGVNHYTARSAVRQKIEALAGRTETQARDVWDLEHLLRTTGANPEPLVEAERKTLTKALDRAMSLSFDVFKAQVSPYLTPEHQEIYGTPEAWDRICELVIDRLTGPAG